MKIHGHRRGARGRAKAEVRPMPPTLLGAAAAAPPGEGTALRIEEESAKEALERVVAVGVRLGLSKVTEGGAAADAEAVFHLGSDAQAPGIAAEQSRALREHPKIEARSGVTPDALLDLQQQHREMATMADEAVQLDEGLDKARRVLGEAQRQEGDKVEGALAWLIKQSGLDPKKQDRLRVHQARLEAQAKKIQEERDRLAEKTRSETEAGKAKLHKAKQRLDTVRTWDDLREGRPVDPEAVPGVLETLDDIDVNTRGVPR